MPRGGCVRGSSLIPNTYPIMVPVKCFATCVNSEQGRHYHTLEHVADLLEGAERDFDSFRNRRVVQLAIFFHE